MSSTIRPPKIIMTPPTEAEATSHSQPQQHRQHPRRPPAHRSVSLLHSPRRKAKVMPTAPVTTTTIVPLRSSPKTASEESNDSPSSLRPHGGKTSSGESSSTAEKWFEKSNNHVRDTSGSFADNEPPYFLRNTSSSSDTSPHAAQRNPNQSFPPGDGDNSLPLQAALLHIGTDASSTDDFRGVIDDLTIENKKLKRRLKRYEKLHDSHLKDEKLFEVRVHGLPPEKKRELEDTLRKFAVSLQQPGFPTNGYDGLLPMLKTHKTSSSQTSLHNTDSAYASMSASGPGSSAHSAPDNKQRKAMHAAAVRQHNIHTYLHQIPEGLLPQSSPTNMSERAKKKLVVGRLEQLFSGKGAALDGHQQPIQQQEVSRSAALADQSASEALGQRARQEGNREASIMSAERGNGSGDHDSNNDHETSPDNDAFHSRPVQRATDIRDPSESSPKNPTTSEQRPTRPLDLDPHRAQIPAENLRYMRHLGFSPLDLESSESLKEGHGWIYLNLLVNMAQLHTINVTSEFVSKAVSELSDKFEMSPDGRKIRWKGRNSYLGTGSEAGSGSAGEWPSEHTSFDRSPRKRPKLGHRTSSRGPPRSGMAAVGSSRARSENNNNKLVYTPLFFHKDSTDEAEASSSEEDEDLSSPYPTPIGGDSSGMTSSGVRTVTTKKNKKLDDGPIIFYNNARFCTDLSGERNPEGNRNAPTYAVASVQPLGKPRPLGTSILEKRGPLAQASELPDPMDLSDNPIPDSLELSFPPSSPSSSSSSPQPTTALPIDLEVTGMGGVWPSDHFAIRVQSRHARMPENPTLVKLTTLPAQHIPPKLANVLQDNRKKHTAPATVDKKVVSSVRQELVPSELPPALSYMRFGEGSISDDDESSGEEDDSVIPESPGAFPPTSAPQLMDLPDRSDSEDEDEEEEDPDSDGGDSEESLDLLASARQVDPEAIRAREREYDANMAERLAEEIPAGSSAATAGGGSGFASPVSGMEKEHHRAVRNARGRRIKRARISDSTEVHEIPTRDGEVADVSSDSDDEMNDASS